MKRNHQEVLDRREKIEAPPDLSRYTTLSRIIEDGTHRLVLSMGGGAVPGLAGNVALAVILEELGMRKHISEIWGTSAGAVVGGGWATGAKGLEILELLKSLDRRGVLDITWFRLLKACLLKPFGHAYPDGLIRGRHFLATIDQGLHVKTFEDCKIPFRCIACTTRPVMRAKIFKRGPLLPPIFASMSLPGIIQSPAWNEWEEGEFYDGGIVEKTPLISPVAEHARSGDSRKIFIIATHYSSNNLAPPRGFYHKFVHSIYGMEDMAWRYQVKEVRQRKDVVLLLLDPSPDESSLLNFSVIYVFYLQAREYLLESLQNHRVPGLLGLE